MQQNKAGRADDGEDSDDHEETESDSDEEDDDKSKPLQFKCSNLLLRRPDHQREKSSYQEAGRLSAASHSSLSGVVLVSCHQDGTCKLWDLATRRCIVSDATSGSGRRDGLAVRRLDDQMQQQFLYQSRDILGTVSLHDIHRPSDPIVQLHTHSTTFCQMAPCCYTPYGNASNERSLSVIAGGSHLIALPTQEQSVAIVRDLRCDPTTNPIYRIDIGNDYYDSMAYHSRRSYGMLTSLGLFCLQEKSQQRVLGCGMEDGSALFYDLRAKKSPWLFDNAGKDTECSADEMAKYMCRTKLGKDPVLTLDLSSKHTDTKTSVVAVAGCAGDSDELSELPEEDQGTISTIKIDLTNDLKCDDGPNCTSISCSAKSMKASIQRRTRTCSADSGGKVGVSVCRFRPDGRIFAVGGWDRRLRLFDRASTKPLAILHGHESTVTTVDWEGNAPLSGLLATGAGDGRICIYKVFPNTSLNR